MGQSDRKFILAAIARWGMLVAVPLTTVLYRLLRQDVRSREEKMQNQKGA